MRMGVAVRGTLGGASICTGKLGLPTDGKDIGPTSQADVQVITFSN